MMLEKYLGEQLQSSTDHMICKNCHRSVNRIEKERMERCRMLKAGREEAIEIQAESRIKRCCKESSIVSVPLPSFPSTENQQQQHKTSKRQRLDFADENVDPEVNIRKTDLSHLPSVCTGDPKNEQKVVDCSTCVEFMPLPEISLPTHKFCWQTGWCCC
eukprot:gene2007-2283_t